MLSSSLRLQSTTHSTRPAIRASGELLSHPKSSPKVPSPPKELAELQLHACTAVLQFLLLAERRYSTPSPPRTMPRLNHRNLRRNIDEEMAIIARFLRQARDREDVSSSLAAFGCAQCLMAFRAATSRPAGRHGTIVAGIAFSGVGTLWAAAWVAADPARRRATGWIILCASLLLIVVAVGLCDDYGFFFDILREIA